MVGKLLNEKGVISILKKQEVIVDLMVYQQTVFSKIKLQ